MRKPNSHIKILLLLGVAFLLMGAGREALREAHLASHSFGTANLVGNASATVQVLVAGDLDNDGAPDTVSVESAASATITAWKNDGSPFSGPWTSNVVGSPGTAVYALAIGDLDNDGRLDLVSGDVVLGMIDSISVWRNDGTPFTGVWTPTSVGTTVGIVNALAVADLDNDGHLDLVSGEVDDGVKVWENDRTPFVGTWVYEAVSTKVITTATALAVGDLDNDGYLDIVSGYSNNWAVAWKNDGSPFVGTWDMRGVFSTTDSIESLALVDLDGDGDLDIVSGCGSGEQYQVAAWQNDGKPFEDAWSQHVVTNVGVSDIAIVASADFDVDGDPDLASGALTDAKFAEFRTWENSGSPFAGAWSALDVANPDIDVRALTVADLDRDGDQDLIAAANTAIAVWPNTRTPEVLGNWTAGPQPPPTDAVVSVSAGHVNHDGKLDIAAGTVDNGIYVWAGDGGYSWTQIYSSRFQVTGTWNSVVLAQIDNVDTLDLAAASDGHGLRAWTSTEYGTHWDDWFDGLPTSGTYHALDLGDVNHDGLLDLVAGGDGVGVRVWGGSDGSEFHWKYETTVSNTLSFCDVALGYVNSDGDLDIVAAGCSADTGIPLWVGDGGLGFTYALPVTTTGLYQAVALGDINNDGDTDVAAAPQTGGVRVWLSGAGTWVYQGVISPTLTVASLDLDDFDNDGHLDILAGLLGPGVRVWKGNGGTLWKDASSNLATEKYYHGVTFGRVDGDAALDVIGAESEASGVRVWTAVEPPPGGWTDFQPTDWMPSQQVTCTVQVADVGSGLDVSTAEYQFSTDGGTSWGAGWLPATVSGSTGTTAPQVMTAANVAFNQDSDPGVTLNAIQFRIADTEGYTGTSPVYYVALDTTPPTNPSDLDSPSHTVGEWSDDDSVWFTWTDGGSDAASGVAAFSWSFSQVADERPDEVVDQYGGAGDIHQYATSDGDWTFHFMTRDWAGNWADPTHLGPYRIDTYPPTVPTLVSSSHTAGGWSSDPTIDISWTSSDGAGSGVAGYSYAWDDHPTLYVDTVIDTSYDSLTDVFLADDQWYFHVRAIDGGANASDIAHLGPFGVDTAAPTNCWVNSPSTANHSSFDVEWYYYDATSGVASYDVQVRDGASGTWTDLRMGTTDTATTYTGAENNHTYYFRVGARDNAGVFTGYTSQCQDDTRVQLLPGVSDFAPSSGFAGAGEDASPLQIVSGTTVIITGSGFTSGTALFNGVAMEPTLSSVVGDSRIEAVIAAGTPYGSAPICVRTPVGEECSTDSFTVGGAPFPVRWGLGFDNFSTSRDDMHWTDFERAFGNCQVNTCATSYVLIPIPCRLCPDWAIVPRPDTAIFYAASRGIADGGDCYGMSYMTLDFHTGKVDADDFAAGADIPASLSCSDPPGVCETAGLVNAIQARHWRQLSVEMLSTAAAMILDYETIGPWMMYEQVRLMVTAPGSHAILCMNHGGSGHCIVPYQADDGRIYVYENNASWITAGEDALDRFIEADRVQPRWDYPAWPFWSGTWPFGDFFYGLPYALVDGPHTLPSDILGLDIIFGSAAGHSSVEDAEGRMMGYDASGHFTHTIPYSDAVPMIPYVDGPPPFEGYYFLEAVDHTVHVSGTASGTYSVTILGDGGTGFAVHGVPLVSDTQDAVGFTQGNGSPTGESLFTLATNEAQKNLTATLVRPLNEGDEQRSFTLGDLALGSGAPLSVTTANGADSLVVGGGAGSTYDVCFYRLVEGQVPAEFCWSDIDLQAGDRHILTPEDWEHLNSTGVELQIDSGDDGTVDQTQWLVGHGLELTMQAQPSVIRSGDRLTYTLAYTVTGEETAPGVVLTTTVPISTTFISASGALTPANDVLTWNLGPIAPPASAEVSFVVEVDQIPPDALIGTMAYLRDESGRWAMAGAISTGPASPLNRIFLPIILRSYGS